MCKVEVGSLRAHFHPQPHPVTLGLLGWLPLPGVGAVQRTLPWIQEKGESFMTASDTLSPSDTLLSFQITKQAKGWTM